MSSLDKLNTGQLFHVFCGVCITLDWDVKWHMMCKQVITFDTSMLPQGGLKIIVKLRQGSGKDRQGMALKAKGLKA